MPALNWKSRTLAYLIIFCIALLIGSYFRTYPLRTHQSHDNRGKATLLVISRLKVQVDRQVETNYAQASPAQKKALKAQLLKDLMRKEQDKVQESIAKVQSNIENASGPQGRFPYLLAADSFHFYQLTERLLETGRISDTFRGSKYRNDLMLAPKGHMEPITLHPHVGALVYRTISVFQPGMELMEAVGYTPLVLSGLSLAAFLLACRGMCAGLWSTLIGAVFFFCSPIFVKRSAWGWYDNDPYNTLFPLLILAVLFHFYRGKATAKRTAVTVTGLGLLMLAYAYFWQGWMLMLAVAGGGLALACAYSWLIDRDRRQARLEAGAAASFVILIFVLITLFFGGREFFLLFEEGFIALKNFLQPQLSVWPDLYISVGELHQASLFEIIVITGGFMFFSVSLVGLIASLLGFPREDRDMQVKTALVLGLFLGMAVLITLGAQRFALLCLTPVSLLFVAGLDHIMRFTDRAAKRIGNNRGRLTALIMTRGLLSLLLFIPLWTLHRQMPKLLNPIYNNTWHAAMTDIAEDTPPDSIINAWWPPGHFIKATGRRRVTFDGATINYPQAYWLTRAYLGQSEQESLGILRMLNTSANDAAEFLEELGFRTSSAVSILRAVTALNSRQSRLLLSTKIPEPRQVDRLLDLTHGQPPPSYIFIYKDLVEKNIQLAFIGNWNFRKIEELNATPDLLARVPDRNSREYVQFLWKLAGGPYKYHTPLREMAKSGDWLIFEKDVRINLSTMMCVIDSEEFGRGVPQSIIFVRDGEIVEQVFDNPTLGYSVTLYLDSGKHFAVLMDRYLAKSMIMRLYYFGDIGMRYVRRFSERTDLTRQTDIRIFEVDWDAFQRDFQ